MQYHTIIYDRPDGTVEKFRAPEHCALLLARALAERSGYYGHVAVIGSRGLTEVSPDGSLEVSWSDGKISKYDNLATISL